MTFQMIGQSASKIIRVFPRRTKVRDVGVLPAEWLADAEYAEKIHDLHCAAASLLANKSKLPFPPGKPEHWERLLEAVRAVARRNAAMDDGGHVWMEEVHAFCARCGRPKKFVEGRPCEAAR